jgi:saccharopine dehydrogenase-like NADP-dependent oxidoreductase
MVLGGAGAMGQVIVKDLSLAPEPTGELEIIIADYREENAEELANEIRKKTHHQISTTGIDITSTESMESTLRNIDCVINSTPYIHNVQVMQACLNSGSHYLDLGGLFHVTREQLKLDQAFKDKSLCAIIGMGAAPGLTNIMAAYGQEELDTIDSIDIYDASQDNTVYSHPFFPTYSLETIIDEYTRDAMVFSEGKFKAVPALSGAEIIDFPAPVGRQETILTLHSEIATLPLSYADKGLRQCTFRLGLPLDFHEKMKFLMSLGLGSDKAITSPQGSFIPRKILASLLAQFKQEQIQNPDDFEIIRVDLRGARHGQTHFVRMETLVCANTQWLVSSGALNTAVPPSIVAQMIIKREIKATGVLPPEVSVPALPFFSQLARRNIIVHKSINQELCRH